MSEDGMQLEQFLNRLKGEFVSTVPNIKHIYRPMGANTKVDFLLIVEEL